MEKLPPDIADLSSRIEDFKQKAATPAPKHRSQLGIFLEYAFRMATEFVSPIIIALCLGYLADKFFDTKPVIMIILLFFGIAAGTLNIYKASQKLEKDMKE